jgi:lysozyme
MRRLEQQAINLMDLLDKTAPPKLKLSSAGADLTAYQDPGGVWTIGWGRAHGVQPGQTCSQDQADQWFREDVAEFERMVNASLRVPVSQRQFDALVSLTYNGGLKHDLFAAINSGESQLIITGQWMRWCKDHLGEMLDGLVHRRMNEVRSFFSDPWPYPVP